MARVWASLMCCLMVAGRSFPPWNHTVQSGHDHGCRMFCSSSPEWTALSSLSSPLGFRWVLVGVVWVEPSWLDGLEGGLLVGVEALSGERVPPSELRETSESSAKTPNLLLVLHMLHALCSSSESMTLPGPEITKWEL